MAKGLQANGSRSLQLMKPSLSFQIQRITQKEPIAMHYKYLTKKPLWHLETIFFFNSGNSHWWNLRDKAVLTKSVQVVCIVYCTPRHLPKPCFKTSVEEPSSILYLSMAQCLFKSTRIPSKPGIWNSCSTWQTTKVINHDPVAWCNGSVSVVHFCFVKKTNVMNHRTLDFAGVLKQCAKNM